MVSFTPIPLVLMLDIAKTSSRCDELMDTLNDVRAAHGARCDAVITYLENCLLKLYHGQGLGFVIGSTVIDMPVLKRIALKLALSLGSIVTYLQQMNADETAMCTLLPEHKGALKALVASW